MDTALISTYHIFCRWSASRKRWLIIAPRILSFEVTEDRLVVRLDATALPDTAFRAESLWMVATPDYTGDGQPPAEYRACQTHHSGRELTIEASRVVRIGAEKLAQIRQG
jgi:hypothetical protein